jgi:hypothetical protein
MVTIKCGVNSLSRSDVSGQTVQDIRDQFSDALNIPDDARAKVNSCDANSGTVVCDNSVVEFVKVAGEKGA